MGFKYINVGTAPDDNTGDTIRSAFQKVNNNFENIFGSEEDIFLSSDKGGSISIGETIVFNDNYAFPKNAPSSGDFLVADWTGQLHWKHQSLIEKDGGFYLNYGDGRSFNPGFGSTNLSYQNTTDFSGEYSFTAGFNADTQSKYGISLGSNVKSDYQYEGAITIGSNSLNQGNYSILIGAGSYMLDSSNSYSFGTGLITNVKDNLMILGRWNSSIDSNDSFIVGIGSDDDNRKDGLVIKENGLIQAPEASLTDLSSADPKTLTTKEYVDSVTGGGSLGSIMPVQRGVNIGFQMSINPNVIRVGHSSTSLGFLSNSPDISKVMGNSSLAQGSGTTVSGGNSSFAGGVHSETLTAATGSIAYGNYAVARTAYSQAFGQRLEAYGPNQMVIGKWNAFDFTSKFVIGNGASGARKNVFWVTDDGTTYSDGDLSIATGKALINKEYFLNPDNFIAMLVEATPDQITEIKTLLGL